MPFLIRLSLLSFDFQALAFFGIFDVLFTSSFQRVFMFQFSFVRLWISSVSLCLFDFEFISAGLFFTFAVFESEYYNMPQQFMPFAFFLFVFGSPLHGIHLPSEQLIGFTFSFLDFFGCLPYCFWLLLFAVAC